VRQSHEAECGSNFSTKSVRNEGKKVLLSGLTMRKSSYPSEMIMELLGVLFSEQAFANFSAHGVVVSKGEPGETVSERCHEFSEGE
jgi:hypothetical protein